MEIKVERIDVKKDFSRRKIYTPVDITSQVIMPIIDVERLDTTLDTSSMVLVNSSKRPLKPFTRMKISITNNDGTITPIYRLIYTDNVTLLTYGTKNKYQHDIELIEPTKWLERFDIDNTTITNFLAFLYSDDKGYISQVSPFSTKQEAWLTTISYNNTYDGAEYASNIRIYDHYVIDSTQRIDVRLNPRVSGTGAIAAIPIARFSGSLNYESYTITAPNGTTYDAKNLQSFTFNQLGVYTFSQTYYNQVKAGFPLTGSITARYRYTWQTRIVDIETIENKLPTRYTIRQVVDLILGKVGNEATLLRNGLDEPLFQLDPQIAQRLSEITSPEFTFTQNTLLGVLLQIGSEIQAIPRLVPNPKQIDVVDEETGEIIETIIDDYSYWNIITFDSLGGNEEGKIGTPTAEENTIDADNYASSFVSNIQNSFQTNNADYISLTEPYENGFISTRTDDGHYEISNNHAIIKTSRPIQRIVELIIWYNNRKLDITRFVKEYTDYSILLDYAATNNQFQGYSTKSTAIYYTRGTNIIAGLDYIQPTQFSTEVIGLTQAIKNIIMLITASSAPPGDNLKDLMFKIKYVPYYNLKAKQYKPLIDEDSGNNDLFYNQNQQQSVDIESLGENMKGALMKTSNEEPTLTAYYKDLKSCVKAGQLAEEGYLYQVNKEITNNRVKATSTLSKNWNKLNEYTAIKKNFREWEISERESVENNPNYNEFCIISNELDTEKGVVTTEELTKYIEELARNAGFLSNKAIEQIYNRLNNNSSFAFKAITWVVGTTITQEYNNAGEYVEVKNSFILPCACFSFGNSIALNFGAQDNYAIGTYSRNYNNDYAIENFVKYGDRYGKVEDMELCFGSDNAKLNDFNSYSNAVATSKQFYGFDINQLNTDAIILDYRANSFVVNKDSRQQINYTSQLHFMTDEESIWIGRGFAQAMPFVGNVANWNLKFATFRERPDKFLVNPVDETKINYQDMPICTVDYGLKYIVYNETVVEEDCVGYGLIDNQGRIILYCDKETNAGMPTEKIYFQFRRRI